LKKNPPRSPFFKGGSGFPKNFDVNSKYYTEIQPPGFFFLNGIVTEFLLSKGAYHQNSPFEKGIHQVSPFEKGGWADLKAWCCDTKNI